MAASSNRYERIYSVVARIPRGRVATYGQVARLAGLAGHARLVGYALSALNDGSRIPWHRVVNTKGRISSRGDGSPMSIVQRLLLERERVRFDAGDRISLERFRWPRRSGSMGTDLPPARHRCGSFRTLSISGQIRAVRKAGLDCLPPRKSLTP